MVIMLTASTIFGLALVAMPATGLLRFPFSSPKLLLPSMAGLPGRPARQDSLRTTKRHPVRCCATVMTAAPAGGGEIYRSGSSSSSSSSSSRSRMKTPFSTTAGQPRRGATGRRGRQDSDRSMVGVICRAGGGKGGLYDDDKEKGDAEDDAEGDEDDQSITTNTGGGGGDDSSPAFSFAGIENELLSRSATRTTAKIPTGDSGEGGGVEEEESAWLPRFFPPPSPGDQDVEGGNGIRPLIELPLDGILLQLFPALLIAVVGTFLTIAVQFEASKFDGMVGEDGRTPVITDLRDTRTELP